MSKLTKIMHKIFGINADFSYQMGKFGSFKNGAPAYAADVSDIQSLSNFEVGLFDSVVANNAPLKEDINAVLHHSSRQIGYLYQAGIPEWDAASTFYVNSFVSYGGEIFKCLVDNCLNVAPTLANNTIWKIIAGNDIVASYSTPTGGLSFTSDSAPEWVNFSSKQDDALDLVSNASTNWIFTAPADGYYEISGFMRPLSAIANGDRVGLTIGEFSIEDLGLGEKLFTTVDASYSNKQVEMYKKIKMAKGDEVSILLMYHRAAGDCNFDGRVIIQKV